MIDENQLRIGKKMRKKQIQGNLKAKDTEQHNTIVIELIKPKPKPNQTKQTNE